MALTATELPRRFAYNGTELPDPSPAMTPEQVRDVYSATYPELTSAVVEGPEFKDGVARYEMVRAVRDKG